MVGGGEGNLCEWNPGNSRFTRPIIREGIQMSNREGVKDIYRHIYKGIVSLETTGGVCFIVRSENER